MQTDPHIDKLQLPELEALRAEIGLSQSKLCRLADVHASTYSRWMAFIRGQGGHCPQPEKLRRVRDVLKRVRDGGIAA